MEFVEVKTTGNECGLQKEAIQATPPGSGVGAVPLDATEGTLGLNGAVHTIFDSRFTYDIFIRFLPFGNKVL